MPDPLRAVGSQISSDQRGLRDRALIHVGWAAALRCSEIAALVVNDLRIGSEGLTIRTRRSKTDQEAAGDSVAVPFGSDPATRLVLALGAWLDIAGNMGAVFRQIDRHGNIGLDLKAKAVATIVRERTAAANVAGDFAGNSFGAGFATTAASLGRSQAAFSFTVAGRTPRLRAAIFDTRQSGLITLQQISGYSLKQCSLANLW